MATCSCAPRASRVRVVLSGNAEIPDIADDTKSRAHLIGIGRLSDNLAEGVLEPRNRTVRSAELAVRRLKRDGREG